MQGMRGNVLEKVNEVRSSYKSIYHAMGGQISACQVALVIHLPGYVGRSDSPRNPLSLVSLMFGSKDEFLRSGPGHTTAA